MGAKPIRTSTKKSFKKGFYKLTWLTKEKGQTKPYLAAL